MSVTSFSVSVASFIACVRAGRVPTRSELLDAADALSMQPHPAAVAHWRETGPRWEADAARYTPVLGDAVTERIGAKPLAAQFSPDHLPPETGWVHPVGKR